VRQMGELKMPPDTRLASDEIAALTEWVKLGLPSPEAMAEGKPKGERIVTDADRQHWSFRPIANPPLPAVRDVAWPRTTLWPQTSIDAFILSRLESAGLAPAPSADR